GHILKGKIWTAPEHVVVHISRGHHFHGLFIYQFGIVDLVPNLVTGYKFEKILVIGSFWDSIGNKQVLFPILVKIAEKAAPAPVRGGHSGHKGNFHKVSLRLVKKKHITGK